LQRLEVTAGEGGVGRVLAVVDRIDDSARAAVTAHAAEHLGTGPEAVEVIDAGTWAVIGRLVEAGLLAAGPGARSTLYDAAGTADARGLRRRRQAAARRALEGAERSQRMAEVLAAGGFAREAIGPLGEALEATLHALACLEGAAGETEAPVPIERVHALLGPGHAANDGAALIARLRAGDLPEDETAAQRLLEAGGTVVRSAGEVIGRATRG
jgi:hypothetical protein